LKEASCFCQNESLLWKFSWIWFSSSLENVKKRFEDEFGEMNCVCECNVSANSGTQFQNFDSKI
jgi:hypothetical protein